MPIEDKIEIELTPLIKKYVHTPTQEEFNILMRIYTEAKYISQRILQS